MVAIMNIEICQSTRKALLVTAWISLSACSSNSSDSTSLIDSDTGTDMTNTVDYKGAWVTSCTAINAQQSNMIRLELNDGDYRQERYHYDGQDCGSEEDRIFTQIDTGTYSIDGPVDVPSGVVAYGVAFRVDSRIRNGDAVDVSDDQGYFDFLYRDGDTLVRARQNPTGVAAVQVSEELDYSVVYYLEE